MEFHHILNVTTYLYIVSLAVDIIYIYSPLHFRSEKVGQSSSRPQTALDCWHSEVSWSKAERSQRGKRKQGEPRPHQDVWNIIQYYLNVSKNHVLFAKPDVSEAKPSTVEDHRQTSNLGLHFLIRHRKIVNELDNQNISLLTFDVGHSNKVCCLSQVKSVVQYKEYDHE